jgi:hypothetical protein
MDTNSITKTCTKCGQTFPATAEYFYKARSGKYGVASCCKTCWAEDRRLYREKNRERIAESKRQYQQTNQEKIAEYQRQWRENNRDKEIKHNREYYQANREKLKERSRQYHHAHREKIAQRSRKYREANKERKRVNHIRRKARKRSLPDTLTVKQWEDCLKYWNGCCAVCGNQLRDLFGNVVPHADHWLPLISPNCPGTTADNTLPLCNSCNLSKNKVMPNEWLERKYGKRKAKQILERIENYFEWVRNQ